MLCCVALAIASPMYYIPFNIYFCSRYQDESQCWELMRHTSNNNNNNNGTCLCVYECVWVMFYIFECYYVEINWYTAHKVVIYTYNQFFFFFFFDNKFIETRRPLYHMRPSIYIYSLVDFSFNNVINEKNNDFFFCFWIICPFKVKLQMVNLKKKIQFSSISQQKMAY